mgnify:CR=1 FL=1|tara:strand:- start:2699 stop:3619 length:921 start_codon:yes stop_codon:yes gene_type:complete
MNWITMKSLHSLYTEGITEAKRTVLSDGEIKFLLHSTQEIIHVNKFIKVNPNEGFTSTYERDYQKSYEEALDLLNRYNLNSPYVRFQDQDFETLLKLESQVKNGELDLLREQILKAQESVRGVSQMFFVNDKYLDGKGKLIEAVEKILNVPPLPSGKDKQYLYIIPCKKPQKIVLCENLHFLKLPELSRPNNIELWFAGGYNVKMLEHVDLKGLPIYYSCDWDYDGLEIYKLVKERIDTIKILTPNGKPKGILESKHDSLWSKQENGSYYLDNDYFNKIQQEIIKALIAKNQWVIEESNDLLSMES